DVLQDKPDVGALDLGLGGAVVPFVAGGTSDSCSVARSPLFEVSSVTPGLAADTVSLGSSSPWCFPASVDVNPTKPFTFDSDMDCDFAVFGSWVSVGSSWSSSSSFVDEDTSFKRKLSFASFRPSDVEPEGKCRRLFRVSGCSAGAKRKPKPVPPSPESILVTKESSRATHRTLVSHTGPTHQKDVEHRNRVRVKREFMGSLDTIYEEGIPNFLFINKEAEFTILQIQVLTRQLDEIRISLQQRLTLQRIDEDFDHDHRIFGQPNSPDWLQDAITDMSNVLPCLPHVNNLCVQQLLKNDFGSTATANTKWRKYERMEIEEDVDAEADEDPNDSRVNYNKNTISNMRREIFKIRKSSNNTSSLFCTTENGILF
ncbi:uncharacterized protein EV154DRAFT_570913, partial [Mucor mucedo]|uniref:uncharacterized protein n=1 Tax=Mucor mucedo TaxID=29922 RepID=UPI0022202D81